MPRFRIFTNDRGKQRGVPLYSCLKECTAPDEVTAVAKVHPSFGPPEYAPIKAIQWPADSPADREWLRRHVG
jgi:hypothetical protein